MYLCLIEFFEIELIICLKLDFMLNNLQRLICHKTQTTNQPIIQLLAVNFYCDSLVRFHKGGIDNASGRPPDSQHKFLFMQFQFW